MKIIQEIEQEYDLELNKIVKEIKKLKKKKDKKVLLQFPDGMKPYATTISKEIEARTKCICLIWLGSCFGACDVPTLGVAEKDIDLVVSFGHTAWK